MEFPSFVKLEYQPDSGVKSRFLRDVDDIVGSAQARFEEFSGEAQRLVSAALSVKRNQSGSLDLGVEEMRRAAQQQQAIAIAAREVATATALAAKEAGDYSQRTRLAVAATEALAVEEEQAARAALSHAGAVEQVQLQLNKTASATDMVVASTRRGTSQFGAVTNSVRAQRVAFVQLGQQMTDVAIQAQMGARWPTIFVQQVPQMAFALSGIEGKVGSLARTLSGPLGAALFAATALGGPFIAKMLMGADAADDLGKKSLSLHDALLKVRSGTEEALQALKDYNAEQDKARDSAERMVKINLDLAESQLKQALATRQQLQTDLDRARQSPNLAQAGVPGYAGSVGSVDVAVISSAIATNNELIDQLSQGVRNLRIQDASRDAKAAVDPIKAINDRYDDMAEKAKAAAAGNDALSKSLKGLLIQYERQRTAALDAQRASGRAAGGDASLGDMTALIKQLFPGATITSTNTGKHVANSDHYKDHAIDFVPAGGMGSMTKAQVRDILEGAGVDIRRNAGGTEQLFGPGDKGHSDHFHVAWQGAAPDPEKVKAAFAKAQAALQEYADRAGENIARINERFDEQPRLIDQAAAATRQLDTIIADLADKKPPNFETLIAQAEEAKGTIEDALVRPFKEMARDSERRQQIDDLILTGQDAQAQALQEIWRLENQIGDLLPEQRAEVERIVKGEYERGKAIKVAAEAQSAFLDATRSVRGEIERIIAGEGKLGDFKSIFRQLNAKVLTEKIFGGALRDLDQWVKENTGIKDSVDYLRDQTHAAGEAALNFAEVVNGASNRIASGQTLGGLGGATGGGSPVPADLAQLFDAILPPLTGAKPAIPGLAPAANDNEIVVTARKTANGVAGMSPDRYFQVMSARIVGPITDKLAEVVGPKLAGTLGGVMSGALYGYATGGSVGGVLGGLKGITDDIGGLGSLSKALGGALKGAQTGTLVAGLGNAFGLKLSGSGAQLGGAIGSALPIPGGEIIGSIAGGLIGKLFGGTKSGRVTLSGTGLTLGGTSKQLQGAAGQVGGDLLSTLQSVAEQLGGSLGSYGTITLGQRNGSYRVNIGGSGKGSLKSSHGAKDFGTDQEAAIAYALQQAIVHGAVKGISAGAQRLLAAGNDLQAQMKKALDFQGVFDELKQATDPVGYALDQLNKRFDYLKGVFAEAGASAEDYAKLQQLYGIDRAKALSDAMNQVGGSLKSLYDDLTTGDMGLSLRDREKTAQGNYDALAARVRAGDTSAYDDFADAARTLLDIERQLHGSQSAYFSTFDNVRDLTKSTLDQQQALIDAAAGRDGPFAGSGGVGAKATNDNQGVIDALSQLGNNIVGGLGYKLDALNANLGSAMAKIGGPSGGPAQISIYDLLKAGGGF